MKFNISHKTNGVYQTVLVEATTQEIAEAYFREKKPDSELLNIHEARTEDFKPGKPVLVVPDAFRLDFIREHQRAFNEKMAELEKQGLRSGGWDEETDRTAIVKLGKYDLENRIVGYIDRDLNIEWNTVVLSVRFMGNNPYSDVVQGRVISEGHVVNFDCHLEKDEVRLHNYELFGPMKRMIKDVPLPEIVKENMEEIVGAVKRAVYEFLQERRYVSLSGKSVNELLDSAERRSAGARALGPGAGGQGRYL